MERKTMPPDDQSTPPKPAAKYQQTSRARKPSGKVNPSDLIALAEANPHLSQRQLAKLSDVDVAAINRALKRYGIKRENLDSFKANRADVFAGIQEMVARSLNEEDIKKSSIRDRTILLGTLYDKERLERGQSTANVGVLFSVVRSACNAETEAKGEGN